MATAMATAMVMVLGAAMEYSTTPYQKNYQLILINYLKFNVFKLIKK